MLSQQTLYREVVYEQPIRIKTEVLSNTTFYPLPALAITVNNAPTSFDEVTVYQYTQYLTTTTFMPTDAGDSRSMPATVAVSQASPTPTTNEFVLVVDAVAADVQPVDGRKIHKRQSGSTFVSANGTSSTDCATSPIYTISNGVLTANVNGTTYTYSTEPGVPNAVFAQT